MRKPVCFWVASAGASVRSHRAPARPDWRSSGRKKTKGVPAAARGKLCCAVSGCWRIIRPCRELHINLEEWAFPTDEGARKSGAYSACSFKNGQGLFAPHAWPNRLHVPLHASEWSGRISMRRKLAPRVRRVRYFAEQ
jgi:hypothetical protein